MDDLLIRGALLYDGTGVEPIDGASLAGELITKFCRRRMSCPGLTRR